MVEMGVRGDRSHRLVEQMSSGLVQAGDTHPGVDDQVAVASPDMPDVTLHDPDDVRLPQARDASGQPLDFEPTVRDLQTHQAAAFELAKAARISPLRRTAPLWRYSIARSEALCASRLDPPTQSS